MHSTLFYIPDVIPGTGIPVFGVGALLGAWLIARDAPTDDVDMSSRRADL